MFRGISPITIIFALFRAIFVANSIGSLLLVAAVIITVSTSFSSTSSAEVKKLSPYLDLSGSGSIPVTSEPCASASLHTNCPITPRPMTTTFDPRVVSDSLRPCSAILPKTVKAASLMSVFLSIRLHRFSLTTTYSACPPLETTLSPT